MFRKSRPTSRIGCGVEREELVSTQSLAKARQSFFVVNVVDVELFAAMESDSVIAIHPRRWTSEEGVGGAYPRTLYGLLSEFKEYSDGTIIAKVWMPKDEGILYLTATRQRSNEDE